MGDQEVLVPDANQLSHFNTAFRAEAINVCSI